MLIEWRSISLLVEVYHEKWKSGSGRQSGKGVEYISIFILRLRLRQLVGGQLIMCGRFFG
jgi:hypothetical protein